MPFIDRFRKLLGFAGVYKFAMNSLGGRSAQQLHVLKHIRPKPGDRIMDIGCGPATILGFLPDVEYVGVDIDPNYIADARASYGKRGTFICKNVSDLEIDEFNNFDIILATGLLHHLNDDEVRHFLRVAKQFLNPGHGRVITYDGCFLKSGQHPIDRWMLKNDRGQFVRNESQYTDLSRDFFPCIRTHLRSDLLRIPYTLLIMELGLTEAAFNDIGSEEKILLPS